MLMNYHELTVNQPRDTPERRKQFLIICTVMAAVFVYSVGSSGGFTPVEIKEGEFPGGEFAYKHTKRDYAASMGLVRFIGDELGLKAKELADVIYSIYLDDPHIVSGGRQQRFASGILLSKKDKGDKTKKKLLAKNDQIRLATKDEMHDLGARELWPKLKYESRSLPKVKAAVVQFPFTNGFVSALILSWKIIPAMHRYVEAHAPDGTPPVVISTCSVDESMCTHYAPLANEKAFLLGQEECKVYAASIAREPLVDFAVVGNFFKKLFSFFSQHETSSAPTEL